MPGSQCRGRTSQSKDKVFGQEGTAIFAGEYIHQNLSVMTKDQMKYALSMGGEFNLEVGYMEIAKVQSFVKAAVKGGGKINLLKTERLTVSEIQFLCEVGGSHVAFPDMKFEN